jgi:hypothetical protein
MKIRYLGLTVFVCMGLAALTMERVHAQDQRPVAQNLPNVSAAQDAGKPAELQSVPPLPSAAQPQVTPWGRVVSLQVGWVLDQMLVFMDTPPPLVNPDGCTVTTNGYVTNPAHAAHDMFHTMLMSALISGRQVAFVISGCYVDRPQIVSVSIK